MESNSGYGTILLQYAGDQGYLKTDPGSVLSDSLQMEGLQVMKRTGNPNQWKEKAPQKEVLEADIRAGQLYVVRQGNRMTGVFALVIGKDPTYAQIEQGAWISESEYGTLHRVAGDGTVHGLFRRIVLFSEEKIGHLRIDTHADNHIMQQIGRAHV